MARQIRCSKMMCGAAVLALLAWSDGAMAQEVATPDDDPASVGTEPATDDIIVTAQRREERIQSVPVAVSALNAEGLERDNVKSLEDLSAKVPGFTTSNATSYGLSPIAIRGISGAAGGGNVFADEPVAIYVNDIYVFGPGTSVSDLVDVESVQVLRGPQGTLFGRNSTAGAVLLQTARPTFDLSGFVSGELTTLADHRVTAVLSGPLVADRLAARVAVSYVDRDGYARNELLGQRLGGGTQTLLRGSLRFAPTDTFESNLVFEYSDAEYHPVTVYLADIRNINAVSPYIARPDFGSAIKGRSFRYDRLQNSSITAYSASWHNSLDIGAVTVRAITGYRDTNVRGTQDSDGTERPLSQNESGGVPRKQFSQELIVSGETGALKWTTGGYYGRVKAAVDPLDIQSGAFLFGLGRNVRFRSHETNNIYALFADGTYAITDSLSLTAGARYSREHKRYDNDVLVTTIRSGADAQAMGFTVPPTLIGRPAGFILRDPPYVEASKSFEAFTPRVVLDYQLNRDVMFYASFSKGYKSGGYNAFLVPDNAVDPVPTFDPEKITAYEIGIKSDLFDRLLRFNLSAFHYKYKDLQIRLGIPTGGVSVDNAGAARVNGLDLETILRVSPNFDLSLTGAYIDAKFTEGSVPGTPEGVYALGSDIPLVDIDISGNRMARAPKFQFFARAEYKTRAGDYDLNFNASYRYQSRIYFLETNQVAATYQQPGWGQIDLRATAAGDNGISMSLFVTNLANKRVLTQVASYSGLPQGVPNEPRKFGIQLRYAFGR